LGLLRELGLGDESAPRVRLYAGYAVWAPGQLEDEIAAGSWRVMRAQPEHVFDETPENLWQRLPGTDAITAALR
jgi:putative AlgH/UPF0301 family transcriptional regulator